MVQSTTGSFGRIVFLLAIFVAPAHATSLIGCNVAPSGGDITGASLSASLALGNMPLTCNGNLQINDTVTWSANTLTLTAQGNISINAQMNGSGAASLSLVYGQSAPAAGNTSVYTIAAPVNLPDRILALRWVWAAWQ